MSSVSDNQSNWEQPIRSPSVSDEILYELGYSISPSTEEDEAGDRSIILTSCVFNKPLLPVYY